MLNKNFKEMVKKSRPSTKLKSLTPNQPLCVIKEKRKTI